MREQRIEAARWYPCCLRRSRLHTCTVIDQAQAQALGHIRAVFAASARFAGRVTGHVISQEREAPFAMAG